MMKKSKEQEFIVGYDPYDTQEDLITEYDPSVVEDKIKGFEEMLEAGELERIKYKSITQHPAWKEFQHNLNELEYQLWYGGLPANSAQVERLNMQQIKERYPLTEDEAFKLQEKYTHDNLPF